MLVIGWLIVTAISLRLKWRTILMLLIRMERWVMVKILDKASRTNETFST